jgi:hypothetical protein
VKPGFKNCFFKCNLYRYAADPKHMAEDLDVFMNDGDFALTAGEMDVIEAAVLGGGGAVSVR